MILVIAVAIVAAFAAGVFVGHHFGYVSALVDQVKKDTEADVQKVATTVEKVAEKL